MGGDGGPAGRTEKVRRVHDPHSAGEQCPRGIGLMCSGREPQLQPRAGWPRTPHPRAEPGRLGPERCQLGREGGREGRKQREGIERGRISKILEDRGDGRAKSAQCKADLVQKGD